MIDFTDNISLIYGEEGKNWLKYLPVLQDEIATKWQLHDLTPCEDLSYNYVAAGWQRDVPVILKIGIDLAAIQQEHDAILAFNDQGIIKILGFNIDKGAILITRAIPGKTLTTLFPERDDEALEIACNLIKQLHKATIPVGHKFPLLSEWLSIIDKDWDLPKVYLELARALKQELLENSRQQVLLHGDMHYSNILSDHNSWVAIDPKGVIGDPLYDMTGALLREPFKAMMQLKDVYSMLQHRINFVAQYCKVTNLQIWAWTYIQTVMSICWSLEDGQDVRLKMRFLDILHSQAQ